MVSKKKSKNSDDKKKKNSNMKKNIKRAILASLLATGLYVTKKKYDKYKIKRDLDKYLLQMESWTNQNS